MKTENTTAIVVETTVKASVEKVWKYWTEPEHITKWCQASDDWHAPAAENDLRKGGKFKTVMAAKDGSMSFDFGGIYTEVKNLEKIAYQMDDGRNVEVNFTNLGDSTQVTEAFDPENTHPKDFQKAGWQSILDNFRKYVESH